MIACNKLRELVSLAAILLLLPVEGLEARTRKGAKFLKQGRAAEARKDYEEALDLYNQAISQDPQDPAYQLRARLRPLSSLALPRSNWHRAPRRSSAPPGPC